LSKYKYTVNDILVYFGKIIRSTIQDIKQNMVKVNKFKSLANYLIPNIDNDWPCCNKAQSL